VTGSAGQDGSYLVELLRDRGYEVTGVERGDLDLLDAGAVRALLLDAAPQEVYNLASPSFVPRSWEEPVEVAKLGAVGATVLLEAIREVDPAIRVFQASSAEVFGVPVETPQSESTPFRPVSPYGTAKAYATFLTAAYRSRYGLHVSSGILFNHESPRRATGFLPAKVAHGVAAIAAGDAQEIAFQHAGLDWREHVRVDQSLVRGQDYQLVGDASKARDRLGWKPSVTFEQLVALLVDAAREA